VKNRIQLGLIVLAFSFAGAGAQEVACVNSGNIYKIGDIACLPGCHGQQRLARCDMGTNTGTWTTVSNTCPSAMIFDALKPRQWTAMQDFCTMTPIRTTLSALQ
jgi:hypothetical protein